MSGILNRTMRMESRKDRYRAFDWNIVNTTNGACWEPRNFPVGKQDVSAPADEALVVDLDDQINRIDMITFDVDRRDPYHRDPLSNQALIGGTLRHWLDHDFN